MGGIPGQGIARRRCRSREVWRWGIGGGGRGARFFTLLLASLIDVEGVRGMSTDPVPVPTSAMEMSLLLLASGNRMDG